MNAVLKFIAGFCIAGCAGCATTPRYYRSDTPLPEINSSIPRLAGEWDFDYRLAGLQFAPKIENVNNGFDDMDEAAIEILKVLVPLSKATNREYGGFIYEQDNRFYFTNPPVKGSGIIVDVHRARRLVPEGARVTGDYHTHFKAGSTRPCPEGQAGPAHDFSHVDVEDIRKCAREHAGYKGYLGTQEGSIQVFAPHSDVKFYAAWNGL